MVTIMTSKSVLVLVIAIDAVYIVAGFALASVQGTGITRYIGGDLYTRYLSIAQFVAMSVLAAVLSFVRKGQEDSKTANNNYLLWAIAAAGFLFLAFDQGFRLSERIGSLAVSLFNIENASIAGRASYGVLALYGLVVIIVAVLFRKELQRYKGAFPILITGIILILLMAVFHVASSNESILNSLVKDPGSVERYQAWFCTIKHMLEVFGGGVLIGFLYACLEITRKRLQPHFSGDVK
jgi:hypothetical protein